MTTDDIAITQVNINELKPSEYNPRKSTEKENQDLKKSIERFGIVDPIIVNSSDNRKNIVIGGHFRLRMAKEMGYKQLPCVYVNVPDIKKEKELNIRLNKNSGQFDYDLLANFDEDLLKDIGFDSKELDKIFQLEDNPKADDVPDVRTTDIKLGDIFTLGRHRVMCGNSTQRADVEKLMDGNKADMVFTSPPYNLGVSAKLRGNSVIGNRGNAYEDYNDAQDESCWLNLMNGFTTNALDFAEYVFINVQSLAGNRTALWSWVNTFSKQFCDMAIWDKSHSAPAVAHRVMNSVFEMIFVFKKDKPSRAIGQKDYRGTVSNVFRIPPQRKNEFSDVHGATFPVELPQTIIETFTNREGTVIDSFLGSGSTLIACEQTNRICYGMEIDPIYVQVIIDRWEKFTNKKAVKV